MKVLVACEESQAVTIELRKLGHEAFSCDLIPCSGGHPEWHLQQDILPLLKERWDMIIAFPPCTYMSAAGAVRMYHPKGIIDENRLKLGLQAKIFFMNILESSCPKICIENPKPLKVIGLPKETQHVQPYQFGDPYSKLTYLWLKGLPLLKPTNLITENITPYISAGSFNSKGEPRHKKGLIVNQCKRSKTFPGIAKAMAEQWTK